MSARGLRLGIAALLATGLIAATVLPLDAGPARAAGGWSCPLKKGVWFLRGIGGGHAGVDMAATPFPHLAGRKVRAPVPGTVTHLHQRGAGYGKYVVFQADGGRRLVFAHLKKERFVANGAHVEKHDPIGRVGRSGNATTPHLHFEVWRKTGALMDPMLKLGACQWLNL